MAEPLPRVVIVGGGFAGLAVAKALRKSPARVLLIDRTNHHVFQPLLYQVATAVLTPGQIGSPIRGILRNQRNATVILGQVTGSTRLPHVGRAGHYRRGEDRARPPTRTSSLAGSSEEDGWRGRLRVRQHLLEGPIRTSRTRRPTLEAGFLGHLGGRKPAQHPS
jgi:choline dehydrogenase-like flavoprotein